MEPMSPSTYKFWVEINCTQNETEQKWGHQTELWFITFYTLCNCLQLHICLLAVFCNLVSFLALSIECDSALALQLRSLAVCDTVFVLGNTVDNVCHTLESLPAKSPHFYNFAIYAHPIAWSLRTPFLTIHNWTMLFVSAVRYAKIRWPIRANLWFDGRRTAACLAGIWLTGLATSLIRCLEVTTVLCRCPDGLYRAAMLATKMFTVYTTIINYGLQTVTPVAASFVLNVLLLDSLRQRGLRFRLSHPGAAGDRKRMDGQRRETTRVIVLLMQLYLVCQIPAILFGFNVLIDVPTSVYIVIGLLGNVISSLDGACNFFVYVYANPRFRGAVRQLFQLRGGCIARTARQRRATESESAGPPAPASAPACIAAPGVEMSRL